MGGQRRRHGERADLAVELGGIEAGAGLSPEVGSQLEVAVSRPVGEHAEEVADVGLGVEAVQACGGDEPVSWKKDTGILDVVRANVAPCVYFDSDALVGDVPRQRDHIHPSAEGGARWADALFRWLIDHRKSGAKWAIQPRP